MESPEDWDNEKNDCWIQNFGHVVMSIRLSSEKVGYLWGEDIWRLGSYIEEEAVTCEL